MRQGQRCVWLGLAVATILLARPAAGRPDDAAGLRRWTFAEPHMGTEFRILLYSPDEATATRASHAAFARIKQLDDILSDYKPDSELMRLCDRAGGPAVPVGPDLFAVLQLADEIRRRSDGALDVSVGPAVRLWRRARRDRKLPDPDLLAKARAVIDGTAIELDPQARTVRLRKPGMRLDLGAIAKGYASSEAIAVLKREGVARALVAGSGDLVASDPPPDQPGWTVAVATLTPVEPGKPEPTFLLKNAAVSTSGDAEQFVEIDGVRYSHVVDPRTGVGLTERRSVTVIAPDGASADGLDTAACVLGPEAGLALIEATPGAACRYTRITPRGVEEFWTSRWPGRDPSRANPSGPSPRTP